MARIDPGKVYPVAIIPEFGPATSNGIQLLNLPGSDLKRLWRQYNNSTRRWDVPAESYARLLEAKAKELRQQAKKAKEEERRRKRSEAERRRLHNEEVRAQFVETRTKLKAAQAFLLPSNAPTLEMFFRIQGPKIRNKAREFFRTQKKNYRFNQNLMVEMRSTKTGEYTRVYVTRSSENKTLVTEHNVGDRHCQVSPSLKRAGHTASARCRSSLRRRTRDWAF